MERQSKAKTQTWTLMLARVTSFRARVLSTCEGRGHREGAGKDGPEQREWAKHVEASNS
jgi:hypothetical protein